MLTSMIGLAMLASAIPAATLWWAKPDTEVAEQRVTTVQFSVHRELPFHEAIVSWNLEGADTAVVKVEAQAKWGAKESKWYQLGTWSRSGPRESVKGQRDADGNLETDTLVLKQPTADLTLRFTIKPNRDGSKSVLRFVSASLLNTQQALAPDDPKPMSAWGKVLEPPRKRQRDYPNGGVICSPTSLTMVLNHWGSLLGRAELKMDVPLVVDSVWDTVYRGAGNWPFNAAFAGSFPGIRAYVSRLSTVRDLERWIEAGLPVICSVSYDMLRGRPLSPSESGHLVVLVGFTAEGDPVFNDPAYPEVRKVYRRSDFVAGWNYSHRTVYLVYPEGSLLPEANGAWVPRG